MNIKQFLVFPQWKARDLKSHNVFLDYNTIETLNGFITETILHKDSLFNRSTLFFVIKERGKVDFITT